MSFKWFIDTDSTPLVACEYKMKLFFDIVCRGLPHAFHVTIVARS